ncbi:response regulator [Pedobacter sp. ISL-68]|uniref:response regulator n=1 Tax=unclassified Pedobacter TaxID=2628915 RepID=UPI001BE6AFC9|nr:MULTISPECIES: response regulator [unclassified Pedobacter]MBT2560556.1 response regulator [Pedobacter sp. ISL-64]MBT2589935.1 response regulator [Pedobacter sp. ISL-68]
MKKILVVDDNQEILEVIELILRLEGYQVSGLMDASHFNHRISEFKPDLILLDVMLGALDGRDLCNLLKANELTLHIPVIMISASHNLNDTGGIICHPNDFIAKPFDISNLVNKISAQLAA